MIRTILSMAVLIVFGVGLLAVGVHVYQAESELTDRAVEVDGTIVGNDIEEFEETTEDRTRTTDDRVRTRTETRYRPIVTYEYEFEGETYENDDLDPWGGFESFGTEAEAQSYLDSTYPTGSEVTVYVDPEDPETSYLEEPDGMLPLLLIGTGAVCLLVGLLSTVRTVLPF